jgi:hypothetical protein
MATKGVETRRGFLSGLLLMAGGGAAAAFSGLGCAAPSRIGDGEVLPAAGVTEAVALSPGNYYGNMLPDHVAAVRMRPLPESVPDLSTSKGYE